MSTPPHLASPFPAGRAGHLAAVITLLLLTLPWWGAVRCPFIDLDDPLAILHNPAVQAGLTRASIAAAFTTAVGGLWAPLTFLSLMLDVSLWGPGPAGMHATNVALHVANTLLLYALLVTATGRRGRSLLAAALWSLHPLRAESVLWVFERKDVLCLFFGLLALLAWTRYLKARHAPAWYVATLLLWICSMMCKPMLITLPLLLLLLDLWPLARPALAWPRKLLEKLPLVLVAGLFSLLTTRIQASQSVIYHDPGYGLTQRLATIFGGYLRYLRDTVYPARLALFYPDLNRIPLSTLCLGLLVILGLTALALAGLLRARRAAWPSAIGWLWFLLSLLPVIGIIQSGHQTRADRYTYFPAIGLSIALVWLLPQAWLARPAARRTVVSLAALVLLALAAATVHRISLWRDPLRLYADGIAHTDHNYVLKYLTGMALRRQHRDAEAIDWFGDATLDMPTFDAAYSQLGVALMDVGRVPMAVEAFRRAAALAPENAANRDNYRRALERLQELRRNPVPPSPGAPPPP